MTADARKPERVSGWALAVLLAINIIVLRASPEFTLAAFAVLLAGAVLRGQEVFVPPWLGRVLLVIGVVAVMVGQSLYRLHAMAGELAGMAGVLMLLRPVTPARGLRVLCCVLVILISTTLKRFAGVGTVFVIIDVAALLILAEQIHRPPEAAVSFWVSVMRSLRLIVPVGAVVSMIFWLFPNLSAFTTPAFTGFSGEGMLDPDAISDLMQSRRVAMVAHFGKDRAIPPPGGLYWRGQVLERNEGLRWLQESRSIEREKFLLEAAPADSAAAWRYSLDVTSTRGSIVPVLDHAVFVEARRGEQEITVLDAGAAVLTVVGGGQLTLDAWSTPRRVTDAPRDDVGGGALGVPEEVRQSMGMWNIAARAVPAESGVPEKLRALGGYFRETGFVYTTRPGRGSGMVGFLVSRRRGFCEHYAAAAANLLRLGGVPARVVTGYRGGVWNPWLRTITVRDSDAHAWVEAWDEPSGRWLRFDPTDYVAPERLDRIEREMNSDRWPWHRSAQAYVAAQAARAGGWWNANYERMTESPAWEYVQPSLSGALILGALAWLVRNSLRRRAAVRQPDASALVLEDLERRAARTPRERRGGETPLAWLGRIARSAEGSVEGGLLRDFARSYEDGVYRPAGFAPDAVAGLRANARQLRKIWSTRPPART